MSPAGRSLGRIAIVDDDADLLAQLVWALKGEFEVVTASDGVAGRELIASEADLFLFDLRLPPSGRDRRRAGPAGRSQAPRIRTPTVVMMSGETERLAALQAIALGAFDFFQKPVDAAELELILRRALERRRLVSENRELRRAALERPAPGRIVGESEPMRRLAREIAKVAPSDASVLLLGESGTGKELLAHAIHERQPAAATCRSSRSTPRRCRKALAEAELFGHERGAFTGAVASRAGPFELAARRARSFSTRSATLSAAVQAKLLRALESREIERVGGRRLDRRGRPARLGDQRGPRRARRGGHVPRGPLLPDQRRPDPHPAAARADRGRRAARPPFPGTVRGTPRPAGARLLGRGPRRARGLSLAGQRPGARARRRDAGAFLRRAGSDRRRSPASAPAPTHGRRRASGSLPERIAAYEKNLIADAIAAAGGTKAEAARRLGLDPNQMKYLCRKYGL